MITNKIYRKFLKDDFEFLVGYKIAKLASYKVLGLYPPSPTELWRVVR
jgi:hypothetical protein